MANEKLNQDEKGNALPAMPIHVQAQYIKDLSFECPDPLKSLQPSAEQPSIGINVEVQAQRVNENNYEVVLVIKAEAARKEEKTFVLELAYGGVFMLNGVPEEMISPIVLIECPRILFPFARSLVANITREAGFPPLSLSMVDFAEIYRNQMSSHGNEKPGESIDNAAKTQENQA